jgi:hypothetical protein
VCFGNVVSGRLALPEQLDNLAVPAFNTVPFRMNLTRHSRRIDAMRAAQRINAASISHQFSPLRMVLSRLGFAETGIFSSILLMQSSPTELDTKIWNIEHEHGVMDVNDWIAFNLGTAANKEIVPINIRVDTQ